MKTLLTFFGIIFIAVGIFVIVYGFYKIILVRRICKKLIGNLTANNEFMAFINSEFPNYRKCIDSGKLESMIIKYSKLSEYELDSTGLRQSSHRGKIKWLVKVLHTVLNRNNRSCLS